MENFRDHVSISLHFTDGWPETPTKERDCLKPYAYYVDETDEITMLDLPSIYHYWLDKIY